MERRRTVGGGEEVYIDYKPVKDYPKYTVPFYPQVDRMKRIR